MKIEDIEDIEDFIKIVAGLVKEGILFEARKYADKWCITLTGGH